MATFNITGTIIGNGGTSPSLPIVVTQGDNQAITFDPDPGWQVDSVKIDGFNLGAVGSHTFTDVQDDYDLEITFIQTPGTTFPIVVEDNAFGIISPGGTVQVPSGNDQIFSVVASAGFEHEFWVIDGGDIAPSPTFTFFGVVAPHTIGAKFKKIIAYAPSVKLLKVEPITVKRRAYDRGDYDTQGYRNQGPLFQTFQVLANRQPGQTQSGMLQAVGEQVEIEEEYDYLNKSWKVFTLDEILVKDILIIDGEEFVALDVDDWSNYNLRSINYRTMTRRIKSRLL